MGTIHIAHRSTESADYYLPRRWVSSAAPTVAVFGGLGDQPGDLMKMSIDLVNRGLPTIGVRPHYGGGDLYEAIAQEVDEMAGSEVIAAGISMGATEALLVAQRILHVRVSLGGVALVMPAGFNRAALGEQPYARFTQRLNDAVAYETEDDSVQPSGAEASYGTSQLRALRDLLYRTDIPETVQQLHDEGVCFAVSASDDDTIFPLRELRDNFPARDDRMVVQPIESLHCSLRQKEGRAAVAAAVRSLENSFNSF